MNGKSVRATMIDREQEGTATAIATPQLKVMNSIYEFGQFHPTSIAPAVNQPTFCN
jgi:hypothetical protein